MKIESGRNVGAAGGPKRAGGTAASGFTVAAEAAQRPVAASATGALTPLDAVLALQAEDDPGRRRARQARRGRDALDALEALEHGLLQGHTPAGLRAELDALQRAGEQTDDPALDAILLEIDIRVAVEIAKLDRVRA